MPELLKVDEAAKVLRCHPETVRRLIKRQELKACHVGRAVRVPSDNLREYLNRSTGKGLAAFSAN
jgi:excisionase family DNA binding protein